MAGVVASSLLDKRKCKASSLTGKEKFSDRQRRNHADGKFASPQRASPKFLQLQIVLLVNQALHRVIQFSTE
ncbi:MAG: hypothetical protein ACKV2V_06905 [Blastocatellia bacterium]